MAGAAIPNSTVKANIDTNKSYLFPLILVTSLFFLWGLAYGLLDVLNKHFQEVLHVTKSRSTLLQLSYFGAYFLMALPAGLFMNKYGYKRGIIMGLLLYATGAFLFYPAASHLNFEGFLIALFILACGLACLETAANPYVTVLGSRETSEQRLNLSQCFNGLGSFLGPIIGGMLFFEDKGNPASVKDLSSVQLTYIIIGILVLVIALFFYRTPLPEIKEEEQTGNESLAAAKPLFAHSHFVWGVITQFFYVAAQVGVGALFLNYATEYWHGTSSKEASFLLSIGMALFLAGRFIGTAIMRKVAANKLLMLYATINVVLCAAVMAGSGALSVYALIAIFFFMSIMFPTIFALGVKDLGIHTKRGASFQIMSIVGGAIVPFVMGLVADKQSTALAYGVPLICFLVVFYYGGWGYKRK
ncbi:L-fucose:H+ symporter permease [Chitinophaga oryziterrae]|uniref:L-fucose:H+ symporter permease n=1 Tax=Chitinophaga oryziterrae TaxID=1031224 RepID=A0A6N8J6Y3_9BACT|nr:L-fucose:H+ symporter permease [Chitinophaga oryziterrae]MVT41025.1 L-fucose:H+ symporter permease [Chitinophaga oryziterrae]